MKRFFILLIVLSCILTGCGNPKVCNHTYSEATCTQAKICTKCGDISGLPLGHSWRAATCTQAKTCNKCGKTEGLPLGHSWKAATCKAPKTCTRCNKTQGEASDHIDNGAGICRFCGEDIILLQFKKQVIVKLIIPTVGSLNGYCQTEFQNRTDENFSVWIFVFANGKGCDNYLSDSDLIVKSGYKSVMSYYRAPLASERYSSKYIDMYLDKSSEAWTTATWKGKEIYIKYNVNGIVALGYTAADIGKY